MPPLKPGRWSVNPGMVAPEWRALWDKAEIVVPFWDPSDHPSEISASAGPMALGGSQLPTWTLTPHGWMAEFGTGGQGGWTTNASSKGMRTYDPFSWFGIVRAGDLTGDEETIASTGTSDYVRFALTGNLEADAGGGIPAVNTTAGEISADDYVLWLWRCDGDAHFSLTGYNLTTGKYLTEDTATGSSDSGAAGPIRLGHRTTNDYGSRQLFFFSTRTFITDEMFAMLVRDPFGPLRMDAREMLPFTQPVNVFTDDFTGTNDDPWDVTKWKDDSFGAAQGTIQSNRGQVTYTGGQRTRLWSPEIDPDNPLDAYFNVALGDGGSDLHIGFMGADSRFRANGSPTPWTGLYLKLDHGIHQASANGSDPVYGGTGTDEAQGQAFTTGGTLDVYGIAVGLEKTGSPADNIFVRVRETSMTGTIVGTSDAKAASGVYTGLNPFHFSTGFQLSSSTTYYLEVYRSGARDTSNYISVQTSNTDPYSGGDRWSSSSGSWSVVTGEDMAFSVGLPVVWRQQDGGGAILGTFGVAPAANTYWYRLRYDGTYVWSKMWTGAKTDEPSFWFSQNSYNGLAGRPMRFFVSSNPGTASTVDDVEVRRSTIVRVGRSGAMALLKPGRWSVQPGMVAPEWRDLWRDLILLDPCWSDGPVNIVNRELGWLVAHDTPAVSLAPSREGSALYHPLENAGWQIPFERAGTGADGLTCVLVFHKLSDTDNTGSLSLFSDSESGTTTGIRGDAQGRIRFAIDDGSLNVTSDIGTAQGIGSNDVSYVVIGRWVPGDTLEAWVYESINPGDPYQLKGSASGTSPTGPIVWNGGSFYVSSDTGTAEKIESLVQMAAVWNRPLSDGELARLLGDPFGPLRMDPSGPELWATASGFVTPTNLQLNVISSSRIDLTWDAVTGATNYDLMRERWNGSWVETTVIEDIGTNSYSDTTLQAGTLYQYRVRAKR